jgi:hypothetical protein
MARLGCDRECDSPSTVGWLRCCEERKDLLRVAGLKPEGGGDGGLTIAKGWADFAERPEVVEEIVPVRCVRVVGARLTRVTDEV